MASHHSDIGRNDLKAVYSSNASFAAEAFDSHAAMYSLGKAEALAA